MKLVIVKSMLPSTGMQIIANHTNVVAFDDEFLHFALFLDRQVSGCDFDGEV